LVAQDGIYRQIYDIQTRIEVELENEINECEECEPADLVPAYSDVL
jgi:hypothetical protein